MARQSYQGNHGGAIMNQPCFECGRLAEYHHHVIPQSKGGTKTIPLCGACHGKAHHLDKRMSPRELTKAALQAKKSRGERVGHIPFGSQLAADGKHLEPCEYEQKTVESIKTMKNSGLSLREVMQKLNLSGVTNRGKSWSHVAVSRVTRGQYEN